MHAKGKFQILCLGHIYVIYGFMLFRTPPGHGEFFAMSTSAQAPSLIVKMFFPNQGPYMQMAQGSYRLISPSSPPCSWKLRACRWSEWSGMSGPKPYRGTTGRSSSGPHVWHRLHRCTVCAFLRPLHATSRWYFWPITVTNKSRFLPARRLRLGSEFLGLSEASPRAAAPAV